MCARANRASRRTGLRSPAARTGHHRRNLVAAANHEARGLPGGGTGFQFTGRIALGAPYQNPHTFSAHLAVVEMDRATGESEGIRYVVVHDCGHIINPLLVQGQEHGGIVPGIGQALWEVMVYGLEGQPLTGSLLD